MQIFGGIPFVKPQNDASATGKRLKTMKNERYFFFFFFFFFKSRSGWGFFLLFFLFFFFKSRSGWVFVACSVLGSLKSVTEVYMPTSTAITFQPTRFIKQYHRYQTSH